MGIRVTEVLNYFKEPWYVDWVCRVGKKEANRISKQSQKIGTRVDELIKGYVLSDDWNKRTMPLDKEKEEVKSCIRAWDKWVQMYKPKSVVPCERLYATIDGQEVTGEPDIMVDDVLVDIKCASKISPSYWIQVNMYRFLENSTKKVAILRLDKETASYEYVVKNYDPSLVSVWCGLMRAYMYFNKEKHDGDEL